MIKHLHQKISAPIDLLKSYMKRIFKLSESVYAVSSYYYLYSQETDLIQNIFILAIKD